MRKLFVFIFIFLCFQLQAQTVIQKGYVRTVGRPDNKSGKRLSNVAIYVSGQHNATLSDGKGEFSLTFNDASVGKDGYKISRVRLSGYEVQEKEMLGRLSPISSTIPREIVLVSLAEKRNMEDKIRLQIENRYQEQLNQLEADKEKLGEAKYQEGMRKMEEIYNMRDQLIMDMVERYSHTDYALLNETEAQINTFIERGELERADSVINSMNLAALEQEHDKLSQDIATKKQEIQKEEQAQKNIVEQLMLGYNSRFEICQAKFQNDSAVYFLEKMVELDTTNWEKLYQTGRFLHQYLAKYDNAKKYYERALTVVLNLYGENHVVTANIYNSLGMIHCEQSNLDTSLNYFEKSLKIRQQFYGEMSDEVANSYNGIANIYNVLGNLEKSKEYCEKSFNILQHIDEADQPMLAMVCSNLGNIYLGQGDIEKAQIYLEKSLKIKKQIYGDSNLSLAPIYSNIGHLYYQKKQYTKAIEFCNNSLKIYKKIYGDNHPAVANAYNNLGCIYHLIGDFSKALDCYSNTLTIQQQIYGEKHRAVANTYFNIGCLYGGQKDYLKEKEYYNKTLFIYQQLNSENHPKVAQVNDYIGNVYREQGDLIKAKEYYTKALTIYNEALGKKHDKTKHMQDKINEINNILKK